jgi:predicted nucleic acid-binding protein
MTRFALDTSCIVAVVCSWHERHQPALAAVSRRLDRGELMTVAAHALIESYAVLTRLPAPHRLSPADAWTLIRTNFVEGATAVALEAGEQIALLAQLAAANVSGGRAYDALIASCALRGKARALLTLNPRHFQPSPAGVVIEEPV